MTVARAVAPAGDPIKMNCEIRENIPHLHLHLFPRSPDDPFVGGPIDPRLNPVARTRAGLAHIQEPIEATQNE